jgi:hypothetical protein
MKATGGPIGKAEGAADNSLRTCKIFFGGRNCREIFIGGTSSGP